MYMHLDNVYNTNVCRNVKDHFLFNSFQKDYQTLSDLIHLFLLVLRLRNDGTRDLVSRCRETTCHDDLSRLRV